MIRAIIIDDEAGCVSNLKYFLNKYCPLIDVVATGCNLEDAYTIYKEKVFDIAFLDVEMGTDNIFSFLKKIATDKIEIVFVTAFEGYALKACKIQAIDYILKPLMKSDIIECYQKIIRKYEEKYSLKDIYEVQESQLLLKQGDKIYMVKRSDVYYLEANGVYTKVVFRYNNKQISLTLSRPIGDVTKDYDTAFFYRVHKSFFVNCKMISTIVKDDLIHLTLENGANIPVAKRRAHDFLSFLENIK